MSALKMLVYILEAETEWFSHRLLMIYKRQQGVTALLLYQAQTVTPAGWLSHGRDLQRPSESNTLS